MKNKNLIESVTQTTVGYFISCTLTMILFKTSVPESIGISSIFITVSFIRQFFLRKFFDCYWSRKEGK